MNCEVCFTNYIYINELLLNQKTLRNKRKNRNCLHVAMRSNITVSYALIFNSLLSSVHKVFEK